jgi:MoaA/NifB/PqqE/SkfB family radical SAM enzyme
MKDNRVKGGTVLTSDTPNWDAFGEYGQGRSKEYPYRHKVEERILPPDKILKLKNPEVRIEPTNLCNYHCVMCPRETLTRPKSVMPMPFYESILDEVVLMGADQITLVNFGESFIDPNLEDKIYLANRKGMKTYIISNVSLLDKESQSDYAKNLGQSMTKIEAAVRAGLKEIRLSFYGTNKQDYEEIMRQGKFEEVEKNLKLLTEIRNKYGKEIISPTTGDKILSPEVSMYYLEMEKDEKSSKMDDFVSYTKNFADYIEVWRPHNWTSGRSYREVSEQKKTSCGRPSSGPIQINCNGIMIPCCFDYNESIPLGNLASQTVEEVLRGKPYQELRRVHETKEFNKVPACNECDQLCERNEALVFSTNELHKGRSKEDIMASPNTNARFNMIEVS